MMKANRNFSSELSIMMTGSVLTLAILPSLVFAQVNSEPVRVSPMKQQRCCHRFLI